MTPASDNPLQAISACNAALLFNMQQEFVLSLHFPDIFSSSNGFTKLTTIADDHLDGGTCK